MSRSAINVVDRLFIDEHGTVYPITDLFNMDGEPCEPKEAVSAVAGAGNHWVAIRVRDFEPVATQ